MEILSTWLNNNLEDANLRCSFRCHPTTWMAASKWSYGMIRAANICTKAGSPISKLYPLKCSTECGERLQPTPLTLNDADEEKQLEFNQSEVQ